MVPTIPRLPLPWAVVCGWAMSLACRHQKPMALALLLSCDAYLRPGEALMISKFGLCPPAPQSAGSMTSCTLTLFEAAGGRPSKTGHYNDSVVLDSPSRAFLGPLLHQQALRATGTKLFDFTYS